MVFSVEFPSQSLQLAAIEKQCLSPEANASIQKVGTVAIALISVGIAAYLVKCGLSEHTCALFPDSGDIFSNLHDILGMLN